MRELIIDAAPRLLRVTGVQIRLKREILDKLRRFREAGRQPIAFGKVVTGQIERDHRKRQDQERQFKCALAKILAHDRGPRERGGIEKAISGMQIKAWRKLK